MNVRNKGKRGEREVAQLLRDELGTAAERNLVQSRNGGHDVLLDGVAIEVKRRESLDLKGWWRQAVEQGLEIGLPPVLFYRQSRRPWRVIVAGWDLGLGWYAAGSYDYEDAVEMSVEGFCGWYRERCILNQ